MAWSLFRRQPDYTHSDEFDLPIPLNFREAKIRIEIKDREGDGWTRATITLIPSKSADEQRELNRAHGIRHNARAHARSITFRTHPEQRGGRIFALGPISPKLFWHEIQNILQQRDDKDGYGDLT